MSEADKCFGQEGRGFVTCRPFVDAAHDSRKERLHQEPDGLILSKDMTKSPGGLKATTNLIAQLAPIRAVCNLAWAALKVRRRCGSCCGVPPQDRVLGRRFCNGVSSQIITGGVGRLGVGVLHDLLELLKRFVGERAGGLGDGGEGGGHHDGMGPWLTSSSAMSSSSAKLRDGCSRDDVLGLRASPASGVG